MDFLRLFFTTFVFAAMAIVKHLTTIVSLCLAVSVSRLGLNDYMSSGGRGGYSL